MQELLGRTNTPPRHGAIWIFDSTVLETCGSLLVVVIQEETIGTSPQLARLVTRACNLSRKRIVPLVAKVVVILGQVTHPGSHFVS
jgi:hypothetical protein